MILVRGGNVCCVVSFVYCFCIVGGRIVLLGRKIIFKVFEKIISFSVVVCFMIVCSVVMRLLVGRLRC